MARVRARLFSRFSGDGVVFSAQSPRCRRRYAEDAGDRPCHPGRRQRLPEAAVQDDRADSGPGGRAGFRYFDQSREPRHQPDGARFRAIWHLPDPGVPGGGDLLGPGGLYRHEHGGEGQRADGGRGPERLDAGGVASGHPDRWRHGLVRRGVRPSRRHGDRDVGSAHRDCDSRRLRFRRVAYCLVHARRWRDFHQGR